MSDTLGERIKAGRAAVFDIRIPPVKTELKAYADGLRDAMQTYTDTARTAIRTYIDQQITAARAAAKSYVDEQIAALVAANSLKPPP